VTIDFEVTLRPEFGYIGPGHLGRYVVVVWKRCFVVERKARKARKALMAA